MITRRISQREYSQKESDQSQKRPLSFVSGHRLRLSRRITFDFSFDFSFSRTSFAPCFAIFLKKKSLLHSLLRCFYGSTWLFPGILIMPSRSPRRSRSPSTGDSDASSRLSPDHRRDRRGRSRSRDQSRHRSRDRRARSRDRRSRSRSHHYRHRSSRSSSSAMAALDRHLDRRFDAQASRMEALLHRHQTG